MGNEQDSVWHDSIGQGVLTQKKGGQVTFAAYRMPGEYRHNPRTDAWARGLLVVYLPTTGKELPFEQLLDQATRLTKATWQSVDGRKLVRIDLRFDDPTGKGNDWDLEVYFDPGVNYLVRKAVYKTNQNKAFEREEEVSQFVEPTRGLFFPERIVGRNNMNAQNTTVLSEIRINEPLPPDIFRLRFPHNVLMTDSVRNTRYRIDSAGRRISAETPMSVGLLPPPPVGDDPETPRGETTEEPKSRTRWILPISLIILFIGLAAAYVRHRWRRRVEAATST